MQMRKSASQNWSPWCWGDRKCDATVPGASRQLCGSGHAIQSHCGAEQWKKPRQKMAVQVSRNWKKATLCYPMTSNCCTCFFSFGASQVFSGCPFSSCARDHPADEVCHLTVAQGTFVRKAVCSRSVLDVELVCRDSFRQQCQLHAHLFNVKHEEVMCVSYNIQPHSPPTSCGHQPLFVIVDFVCSSPPPLFFPQACINIVCSNHWQIDTLMKPKMIQRITFSWWVLHMKDCPLRRAVPQCVLLRPLALNKPPGRHKHTNQ